MTTYLLNEEKMFADIADGVAIIINSDTGIYYGIYDLGTAVFEKLIAGVSYEKVLEALQKMSRVPADIEHTLKAFVEDLCAKEVLVKVDSVNNTTENFVFDVALATEGFFLETKEYSDAQELLMADPIHEVKEDTGWTPEKESIGYTKEETKEREKKMVNNG